MGLEIEAIVRSVILISCANAAPVAVRKLMGRRFADPVDGNRRLADGNPLFGASKTWRGLIAAVISSAAAAPLLGLSVMVGAGFGALSIGADLLASFTKRRLGYAPSSRARLLDVFPEALLPMLVLNTQLGLNGWEIVIAMLIFFVLEASVSPLLYRLHIRNRPY